MLLRLIPVVLTLTFLAACATAPNTVFEDLENGIPAGSGLVVAETIINGTRIVGRVRYWREIVLWRVNYEGEDDTFTIKSLSYSFSTQVYAGVIPAGTYRIGMLYTFLQNSEMSYSARAFAPPAIGTFDVKDGQVTNLGTILYQPFQDRSRIENSYPDYAITRISNDELLQMSGFLNSEIVEKILASASILGWNADDYDEERRTAARLIKNAALSTKMHRLVDGGYLLSGLYGGLYSLHDGESRS